MIQIWKQQGKTVIIAEHRFYYLKELIDRVIYLKNGKIEKDHLASDALKLSAAQQAEMGLRPFDLGAFPVVAHSAVSCPVLSNVRTFILLIQSKGMRWILTVFRCRRRALSR